MLSQLKYKILKNNAKINCTFLVEIKLIKALVVFLKKKSK